MISINARVTACALSIARPPFDTCRDIVCRFEEIKKLLLNWSTSVAIKYIWDSFQHSKFYPISFAQLIHPTTLFYSKDYECLNAVYHINLWINVASRIKLMAEYNSELMIRDCAESMYSLRPVFLFLIVCDVINSKCMIYVYYNLKRLGSAR